MIVNDSFETIWAVLRGAGPEVFEFCLKKIELLATSKKDESVWYLETAQLQNDLIFIWHGGRQPNGLKIHPLKFGIWSLKQF